MKKEECGKDEIYYNEIISKDEEDRLFSPKIFTNSLSYESKGEKTKTTSFNKNDNLILNGNNLIALHSLKNNTFHL